ncbi:MAG: isochorismatase family protein [Rhodobacterales bacterium]|nr:isochorismatase family protein [Rhodobacterales bacterium]
MTAPKTLLQLAGADLAPAAIAGSTLLLIDCQREYVDGAVVLPGVDAAVAAAADLLGRFRAAGAPVVHVAHVGQPGGAFDPDGPGGAFAGAVAPLDGEAVVRKRLPNAFAGTDLESTLAAIGNRSLVVVGFMTHMCVSSTVRAALDHGYRTTVAADATATRPLPDGAGGVVDAATLQRASLAALSDRFAIIAGSGDIA